MNLKILYLIATITVCSCELSKKEESKSKAPSIENISTQTNSKGLTIGLKIGQQAPEILLPDTAGKLKTLSSLRGKYILLDFWASWCGPCRMENPNVARLYQKYKSQDFDILSVALDANRTKWLTAIETDGMEWNHVSDLKKWESAVIPVYNLDAIPMTYLLDKD